ncbi:MAG TPA: hypothetical protein VGE81_10880 [Candidatus Limnocylindrales bacterium]|jgi:hypothetical protein
MALPQRVDEPEPIAVPVEALRIRRCTFRRLSRIAAGADAGYEVNCLYPDRRVPLPLGDFGASLGICGACTATGVFRPDED